jgi:hypothetical protein
VRDLKARSEVTGRCCRSDNGCAWNEADSNCKELSILTRLFDSYRTFSASIAEVLKMGIDRGSGVKHAGRYIKARFVDLT